MTTDVIDRIINYLVYIISLATSTMLFCDDWKEVLKNYLLRVGYMEIKDRIKEIRTAVGITQVKFAQRIAVVASYISEVESGVREINERGIKLIVAEFNVNEEWLRTGQGAMFNDDTSAIESEILNVFKALNKPLQEAALKMLTALAESSIVK